MKKVIRFPAQVDSACDLLKHWWYANQGSPLMFSVEMYQPPRTSAQNAKMWAALSDIAEQVEWYGKKYTKEDWKDILSASWRRVTLAPGVDGGVVALGVRTSKLSKQDESDLIELIHAFGAEQGVRWSDEEAA